MDGHPEDERGSGGSGGDRKRAKLVPPDRLDLTTELIVVREGGLEPPLLSKPDPKSGASTSSAIPACFNFDRLCDSFCKLDYVWHHLVPVFTGRFFQLGDKTSLFTKPAKMPSLVRL